MDRSLKMYEYGQDRALHHLGIQLVEASPGHAVLTVAIEEKHHNALAMGHGGVVFTMADAGMAYAANTGLEPGEQALATGAEIEFLAPAKHGSTLTATASTVVMSGRTGVHDVRVTDSDGAVIALFRGRSRRVSRREG